MKQSGVYAIINIADDKLYIGSTTHLTHRWTRHRYDLCHQQHPNLHLQRAWNRDSEQSFIFTVIESGIERAALASAEQAWMDAMTPEYNKLPMAYSTSGEPKAQETRAKIAASLKGHGFAPETIAKMRAAKLGHKQTAEQIAKRVATTKARGKHQTYKPTPEALARMAANCGHPQTPETRTKISDSMRVQMQTPERREAALRAITGRSVSEETRERHRARMKQRVYTPEMRARMSEGAKRRAAREKLEREKEQPHG